MPTAEKPSLAPSGAAVPRSAALVRRAAALLLPLALALAPRAASANGEPPAPSSTSATATAGAGAAPSLPLPELPRLQPIVDAEPGPGALQDLDRLLERLTAEDERTRTNARASLAEAGPPMVAAIRHRVDELRGSLDRDEAPRLLEDARKAGRKALRAKSKAKGDDDAKPAHKEPKAKGKAKGDDDEGDWLDFLLAAPHPKEKSWQDLTRLLAMERLLTAIGTTPAVRELIALHAQFGEMLRVDLQRQLAKLQDKAVPALLEARQHDAKMIQRWAGKELDALGRAIPGEAVATSDTQVVADVLRAYGRTRDVDAARVVLSYCSSERVQLREAAREAIAAIGEPGMWQLKDQYLGMTGTKAPRGFTWDRIARELFALYDRARLAELYKAMDEGVAAASAGKVEEAAAAFDRVLARAPLFERRKEMVKTYEARAAALAGDHRDDALAMYRKALRLDPKGDDARKIASAVAYLEGAQAIELGAPDPSLLAKALELDPANQPARDALASLEEHAAERQTKLSRYGAAAGIGLGALVAMVLLARGRAKVAPVPSAPQVPSEPGA